MIEYPPVRIEKSDVVYFNKVDDVVGRSVAAGDPMIAFEYIQGLQREGFIKGLAIAKLLFKMKQSWELFRIAGTDDEFESVVEATLGYSPATVNKYTRMWESVFENEALTDDTKQMLMGKPIEALLLLTAAAREGSLEDGDWERIANAADVKEIRQTIRDRRGDQTSSRTAKRFSIYYRESSHNPRGTVIVTIDGVQKVCGHLDLDTEDNDIKESVEKIINTLHMYEIY